MKNILRITIQESEIIREQKEIQRASLVLLGLVLSNIIIASIIFAI